MYHKSLEIDERLGLDVGIARNYINIGHIRMIEGAYSEAIQEYEKALSITQRIGDEPLVAQIYGFIGKCHKKNDDCA